MTTPVPTQAEAQTPEGSEQPRSGIREVMPTGRLLDRVGHIAELVRTTHEQRVPF